MNIQTVKSERSITVKRRVKKILTYTLLSFWALAVLFPFYWMILSSFKSYADYNGEAVPKLFTLAPTIVNYIEAFRAVPLLDYLLNTVIFTVITTASMLIVSVLAAYAFARLDFPGRTSSSPSSSL